MHFLKLVLDDFFLSKEICFLLSDVRGTTGEVPHEQFGHGDPRGQWQG